MAQANIDEDSNHHETDVETQNTAVSFKVRENESPHSNSVPEHVQTFPFEVYLVLQT